MINLQVSKWGNSLAVRIPADYVRQIGVKEGDCLSVSAVTQFDGSTFLPRRCAASGA